MISKMPVIRHQLHAIQERQKTCKHCGGITIYKSDEPERLNFLTNGYCDSCITALSFQIKNLNNDTSNE